MKKHILDSEVATLNPHFQKIKQKIAKLSESTYLKVYKIHYAQQVHLKVFNKCIINIMNFIYLHILLNFTLKLFIKN
jgi:hypothetical protein